MRALLDTNIFVSYLLSPHTTGMAQTIFSALNDAAFTLLLPEALVEEIVEVISHKPRLAARVSQERLNRFGELLQTIAEPIPLITEEIPALSRDPKDNYLLAYAVVGEADYLVTGDNDLLILKAIERVTIVSPAAFVNLLTKHT